MGINFPASPSAGQKFTSGKTLYTFANGAWRAAPLGTALPFNYLVNPAFQISQELGNTQSSVAGTYAADQHTVSFNLASVFGRALTTDPNFSPYYLSWQSTVAKPSLAATDLIYYVQNIEGQRIAGLTWGSLNAKPIVVRLSINSVAAATYSLAIRNTVTGPNRSYVAPLALSAGTTVFEIAIPGDTTGTWASDTSGAMSLTICGCTGTQYQTGSPNSWQAGNFIGHTGMSNQAAAANTYITIGHLGLYLDPQNTGRAPLWEPPMIRQDMFDSQRYWQKCMGALGVAANNTTTHQRATYPNQAPMRIPPASTLVGAMRAWDQATAPNITAIATQLSNTWSNEFNFTASAVQNLGRGAMLIDTSPTIYIAQNARM